MGHGPQRVGEGSIRTTALHFGEAERLSGGGILQDA